MLPFELVSDTWMSLACAVPMLTVNGVGLVVCMKTGEGSRLKTGADAACTRKFPAAVPPPGVGFVTLTGTFPGSATSDSGIATIIDVALRETMVTVTPRKVTTDEAMKFAPEIVKLNESVPAVTLEGEVPSIL